MNAETYRDMHLLHEVTQTPEATQRDFSKRIGAALGLTNLLLRRFARKGYIKIVNVQKSRLQYLITPQGVMEKARLTREYLEYSLLFYRHIRAFLREHLMEMASSGHRRILLWGIGELAEIAFLTIQEIGLELVGVVEDPSDSQYFLGYPVQGLGDVDAAAYDRILVASLHARADAAQRLATLGVSANQILILPHPGDALVPSAVAPAGRRASLNELSQDKPASELVVP